MLPWPGAKSFVARVVAVAAVALASVLALTGAARAATVTPFREVAVVKGALYVRSDGARFAWTANEWGEAYGVVRVFDTLRGRSFRLAAPASGCRFVWIGGGFALWSCDPPTGVLLTDLSTGESREPAGIDQVKQTAQFPCRPASFPEGSIGRYWLALTCHSGFGPYTPPFYLNYRTGRLTEEIEPSSPDVFIDIDYVDLLRPYCAPLHYPSDGAWAPPYFDFAPPFALHASARTRTFDFIHLRRCGTKRVETLSRCRLTDCRTPQLGSRYVTWGEHKRVYAYLPSIRRRVLVGRAPADFLRGRKLSVAHTCNRVFALWGNTIYAARFEPVRGAPPCQTAH